MNRLTFSTLLLLLVFSGNLIAQKYEGLAKTPPMGWNSWNHFACDVDAKKIMETADAMVASGMKDAGYQYIVIDDCWHGERDKNGFIQPDPDRFPDGIKAVADYVHSKGLKFGIYSDAGVKTCGGKPGSRGYEFQDAKKYAEWGVDYLKYDWCNTGKQNPAESYKIMRDALYEAGRPIVLSICEWGDNKPWEWGKEIGHLWRTTGDIVDCWECEYGHGDWSSWGVMKILDMQVKLREYNGPDHWNDPDMMEVGNALTVSESRAHFSMWCMLAAPLIAGNDIREMSPEITEILTNKEVIAIDQDPRGVQAFKWYDYGDFEIWIKPLKDNDFAVAFLNRGESAEDVNFDWSKEYIGDRVSGTNLSMSDFVFQIRDLWAKEDLGTTKKKFKTTVPPHDVVMVRLTKK